MDKIIIEIDYGGLKDTAELNFEPYEDEEMEALELPEIIEEYVEELIHQRVRWTAERRRNNEVLETFTGKRI